MSDAQLPRPTTKDDREGWLAYWTALGMAWRTEPEIGLERQAYLDDRRNNPNYKPDIKQGIYPFKDIKLDRADVEWLLVTHHGGRWPTEWGRTPPGLRRQGIDLRGADLRNQNLQRLPLMQLRAGLDAEDWGKNPPEHRNAAAIHLECADLHYAYLQDASLRSAHLAGANLQSAHLEGAMLRGAHFGGYYPEGQTISTRRPREPQITTLRYAHMDAETNLPEVQLGDTAHNYVRLADAHWNGTDVTRVPWSTLSRTGDEQRARQLIASNRRESRRQRTSEYLIAERSYRQLAAITRSQGLTEDADRFSYRAQLCQRVVLRLQRHYLRYLGSGFLWLIAGYGYRPWRSVITYAVTIVTFAVFYWCVTNNVSLTHGLFTYVVAWLGMRPPEPSPEHLQGYEALVVSVTSFHGRGFQSTQSLDDKAAILSAIEAAIGLLLEITFIATFTHRFFAR